MSRPVSPDLESDSDVTLVMAGAEDVARTESPEGASPSAEDAGAAPCVKDEVLEESPAKKPRTESDGCFAQGLSDIEEQPALQAARTESRSQGCFAQASPGQRPPRPSGDPNPKVCGGCKRQCGVSPCFYNDGETVPWAYPDGRGNWCKDCYSVYRTWFQKVAGLMTFQAWLDAHAGHRACFDDALWSYITQKFDDARVSRPA